MGTKEKFSELGKKVKSNTAKLQSGVKKTAKELKTKPIFIAGIIVGAVFLGIILLVAIIVNLPPPKIVSITKQDKSPKQSIISKEFDKIIKESNKDTKAVTTIANARELIKTWILPKDSSLEAGPWYQREGPPSYTYLDAWALAVKSLSDKSEELRIKNEKEMEKIFEKVP